MVARRCAGAVGSGRSERRSDSTALLLSLALAGAVVHADAAAVSRPPVHASASRSVYSRTEIASFLLEVSKHFSLCEFVYLNIIKQFD